jgi:hypothetical protein
MRENFLAYRKSTYCDAESTSKKTILTFVLNSDAATIDPVDSNEYTIFVQSTSWNRNLEKGTRFLYDKGTSAA